MSQGLYKLEKSIDSNERLVTEENWLDACRTHHGIALESFLPLEIARATASHETIDVISNFVSLVNRGITPPAHILTSIAEGFGQYLLVGNNAIDRGKEAISLDRAFKLSSKQSVGHPLKHRREKLKKGRLVYKMWEARKRAELQTGKRISKNEAYAQAIAKDKTESYDEAVMLKEYANVKADKVFGEVLEAFEQAKSLARALSDKSSRELKKIITKL
ncbi:hypothetical protein RO575_21675 [Methylomonas sp. MO1]|uniref:hypothetical protein n=1 Tax=Methylomonas sp. MO1 TaxID=3073619 RepID=UPI0028A55096|nr:hypothetical protein [Methylomonas sp. MO1]MDT4292183.1 hypothetical protein [Methylomonas sp. MO1]